MFLSWWIHVVVFSTLYCIYKSAFADARLSVSPLAHSLCESRHSEVTGHSGSQHTGQYELLTESIRRSRSGFWSSGAATIISPYGLEPFTFCNDQQFLAIWPGLLQKVQRISLLDVGFRGYVPCLAFVLQTFLLPFPGDSTGGCLVALSFHTTKTVGDGFYFLPCLSDLCLCPFLSYLCLCLFLCPCIDFESMFDLCHGNCYTGIGKDDHMDFCYDLYLFQVVDCDYIGCPYIELAVNHSSAFVLCCPSVWGTQIQRASFYCWWTPSSFIRI